MSLPGNLIENDQGLSSSFERSDAMQNRILTLLLSGGPGAIGPLLCQDGARDEDRISPGVFA
ncbi:MAG: hypothetical protein WA726_02475, partial [Acidimicrobiia bacterium]